MLQTIGFRVAVVYDPTLDGPSNVVVAQHPPQGAMVGPDFTVQLTVASGD